MAAKLAVVSLPATKLPQYMAPALPWLAIACAIAAKEWLPGFLGYVDGAAAAARALLLAMVSVVVAFTGARTITIRYDLLLERAWHPQGHYGPLFAALHDRGTRRVTVVDPGFPVDRIADDHPQLRFYMTLWQQRGMTIDRRGAIRGDDRAAVLASCDPDVAAALLARVGERVAGTACVVTGR
ncbi:hypothetical protein [Sphingomonas panaciterrae]|uniref:hypothetical protein n=1 Tax=Sphingomonas panaciterrae TaxID=1462999 RepID=UPI002FF101A6